MRIWKEGSLRIGIKDAREIQLMREGGKILGSILQQLKSMIVPGITPLELDQKAAELMAINKVKPSFLGYHGYPNVLCINVNNVVVHGIPNKTPLCEGDIVTIDCGVIHEDFHTDAAIQTGVGEITPELAKFLNTAEKALYKAIETVKPGIRIRAISGVIQDIVEKGGYGVVRDLIGHGIGHKLHEDPPVPNFRDEHGPMLQVGMTIAIEPIICMGSHKVKTLRDGWTIVSADGRPATQIEHTIVVTPKGAEILTKSQD